MFYNKNKTKQKMNSNHNSNIRLFSYDSLRASCEWMCAQPKYDGSHPNARDDSTNALGYAMYMLYTFLECGNKIPQKTRWCDEHTPNEMTPVRKLTRCKKCSIGVDGWLSIIARVRGLSEKECQSQYSSMCRTRVVMLRNSSSTPSRPTEYNIDVWASRRQMMFGHIVGDVLWSNDLTSCHLDPVFGALLSPTGGIAGPGGCDIMKWAVRIISREHKKILQFHSVTHDAAGFLYTFFGVGPGYKYTPNTSSCCCRTSSSCAGQFSGLWFWKGVIENRTNEKRRANQ